MAWDMLKRLKPLEPRQAAAKFTEAGAYRVVLQLPGNRPVAVIAQLRRTTGRGLLAARELVESAPVVAAEGLSQQSAELVADQLRKAGARAVAAPIGEM
jgi:large subunit ribosomal protein L7/L12